MLKFSKIIIEKISPDFLGVVSLSIFRCGRPKWGRARERGKYPPYALSARMIFKDCNSLGVIKILSGFIKILVSVGDFDFGGCPSSY